MLNLNLAPDKIGHFKAGLVFSAPFAFFDPLCAVAVAFTIGAAKEVHDYIKNVFYERKVHNVELMDVVWTGNGGIVTGGIAWLLSLI